MGLNVLITGGARGIGEGIVRQLAAEGHNVAFCGRKDAPEFHEQAAEIAKQAGIKCLYYQCRLFADLSRNTNNYGTTNR